MYAVGIERCVYQYVRNLYKMQHGLKSCMCWSFHAHERTKKPSHFRFATADFVLQLVVKVLAPLHHAAITGRADVKVHKRGVVGAAVEVLRLEDNA